MPYTSIQKIGLLLLTSALLAGCGSIATPGAGLPPTLEPVTLAPRTAQNASAEGQAIAAQPTALPPSPTPLPPTAIPTETPLPPTATPTATATPLPPTQPVAVAGDPDQGEILFLNGKDAAPACVTCHILDEDRILIGPSMVGLAARAATRVEGQTAEDYLRSSILHPNDFLVPNTDTNVFAAGGNSLMFQQYADFLSEEDVNNLVAYLLTLD